VEAAAVSFESLRTAAAAADILMALNANPEVRVYRPTVLQACIRTLLTAASSNLGIPQSAIGIREQFRSFGRPLPSRAVGSTLLLKGLEAGAVVILNANSLDAPNLYVALTRGAKAVVVCSISPILTPLL
jgi:DNA helicase-2/ATP-dependent DNA helicase PcrA